MIRIEMNPLDQKDILDLLDYALEMQYLERRKPDSMYYYWNLRIPQLKAIILGKNVSPGIYRSSMGSIETNETNNREI